MAEGEAGQTRVNTPHEPTIGAGHDTQPETPDFFSVKTVPIIAKWHWEFHPGNGKPIALVDSQRNEDVLLITDDGEGRLFAEASPEVQALIALSPRLKPIVEKVAAWPTHAPNPNDESRLCLCSTCLLIREARVALGR